MQFTSLPVNSASSFARLATLFVLLASAATTHAQMEAAPGVPEGPQNFTFVERESRERFDENSELIFPNFEYLPGYYFRDGGGENDDDYDSGTVFRVEYGVENDGATRSKIPETETVTIGGQTFKRLVRDLRDGVVAEPYDEVVVVRLLDSDDPDDETPLTGPAGYDGTLADLCTGTLPGSNQTCAAAGIPPHKNRNSFFHEYTDAPADGNAPPRAASFGPECNQAYQDLLGIGGEELECPVVRFQSERVRCFKCVSNAYSINRGSDNIFSKVGGRTENNIGRLDLIINDPIVITEEEAQTYASENAGGDLLENLGFLLMERNGNDHYAVAAITEVKNIDALLDGSDTSTADDLDVAELQEFARLLRTYDNLAFESPGTGAFDDRPQLISDGRTAESLVTQLGPLLNTLEKAEDNQVGGFGDIWSTTGQTFHTSVFMSSREPVGDLDHFYENRPDQNLGAQTTHGSFVSLADLGFSFGDLTNSNDGNLLNEDGDVEFYGVSLFPADVRTDDTDTGGDPIEYDLITLSNIPRDTSAASRDVGGLDFTGGGGFFFAEGLPFYQLTLSKTASPTVFTGAGETIIYSFTVENTGSGVVENLEIEDSFLGGEEISVSCDEGPLEPGDSATCTASYDTQDSDVSNKAIFNTAQATACKLGTVAEGVCSGSDIVESNEDDETVNLAALSLVKTADPTNYSSTGNVIDYTFEVENTGNVAIAGLSINDDLPGLTGMSCDAESLEIGASTECSARYETTSADVSQARTIENTATATGKDPDGGTVTSNEDSAEVIFDPPPAVTVTKSSDPASGELVARGDTITYTLAVDVANGPTTDDVELEDTLDSGLTFDAVAARSDGFDVDGTTFTLRAGAETGQYTITYTATVGADADDTVGNRVTVTGGDCAEAGACETEHPLVSLSVLVAECVADAPFVNYDLNVPGQTDPQVTVEWFAVDDNGDEVPSNEVPPPFVLDELQGRLLWPGASIERDATGDMVRDENGNPIPTGWPGWEQDAAGNWFEVDTDLRPRVGIRFSINPEIERVLSYPPPTQTCDGRPPRGDDRVVPVPVDNRVALTAMIALLLAVGLLALRWPRAGGRAA